MALVEIPICYKSQRLKIINGKNEAKVFSSFSLSCKVYASDLYTIFCFQDLGAVDHDKIYYASFRKAFYVEVPEIAKMTNEGIYIIK